jgi:hypothetical protein
VIEYRASSYCSLGECVEVGLAPDGGVRVRDGKDRDAGELCFTPEEWAAFLAGAKAGEFDLS